MTQLKKSLKVWDVVAICVGAMFSSGFFLLPGLAYAHTGPSVFLAYIVSGFLILPSMLSQAELSTAMPKAGGTYFFLDRAFGPVIGTIGGLGTFLGLVLKTAFALVGFGAYLQLYMDVPIKWVACGLAVVFMGLNLVGAKESGRFQKILVTLLMVTMSLFILEGFRTLLVVNPGNLGLRFTNFFAGGASEFFYTIAFVFVSYAGLTKIASVAEEIENPDVNIPLGMTLSLVVTVIIYGLGVFVVVGLVPGQELVQDLKPIATAQSYAFDWIKGAFGSILVASAALAAFASTGNAGILASSRYPLAMAKDQLIPKGLGKLNRYGVPVVSILFTGGLILFVILTQSEEGIAKFASAFQLLLFLFINTAVIVMRESKISSYDPGYRAPFYPWTQIFGIIVSFGLLIYMGTMLLTAMLIAVVAFFCWYYFYASDRVIRRGAILHWFAHLGKHQFEALETELWDIMKEKGIREDDPILQIVSEAHIVTLDGKRTYEELAQEAAGYLADQSPASRDQLKEGFVKKTQLGAAPIVNGLCMSGLRLIGLGKIKLVVIWCPDTFSVQLKDVHGQLYNRQQGKLALFLLSPEQYANAHLRLMANWITQAEQFGLINRCMEAKDNDELRNTLFLNPQEQIIDLANLPEKDRWIGKSPNDVPLSKNSIVIRIIRNGKQILPSTITKIEAEDKIILINKKKAEY